MSVKSTRLRCPKCGHIWSVKGKACYPKSYWADKRFIKVSGIVKACRECKNAEWIRVVDYEFQEGAMAKIEGSIEYVLQNEGGFVIDDGGPTNWGITYEDVAIYRKVPASSITIEDMKQLSIMEATEIYRELYWQPLLLDQVAAQNVATAIFDIGVNRGIRVGAKYAQRACKLLGLSVAVDGVIGRGSIAAINMANPAQMIRALEAMEMAGYEAIIAEHPEDEIYRDGWEKRAARLLTLILQS